MAPEIIKRENPNPLKTDIWALGILIFYFMCGAFPFRGQQSKDVYAKILKGNFVIPDAMPNPLKWIIPKLLAINPSDRISCWDILQEDWLRPPKPQVRNVSPDGSSYLQTPVVSV